MNRIKQIVRNALKNKETTSLNILGLTVGFTCSILLISWIIHESTFDNFVTDKDKIYRAYIQGVMNNEEIRSSGCMHGIAEEAVKKLPQVESACRTENLIFQTNSLFKTDNNRFAKGKGFAADETFFDFFPYELAEGTLENALSVKGNIVIDQTLAKKCFGKESAIGRNLFVRENNYTVVAVIKDVPSNSHLQFQYIIPIKSLSSQWLNNKWGGDNALVYLKLKEFDNAESLNSELTSILLENAPFLKDFDVQIKLQQLKEIPFDNNFKFDNTKKTSKRSIYILSVVSFLIVFIASVNFTNLFISSIMKRRKEIGIKISNGANKSHITKEYLIEVFIYVFTAFIISIACVYLVLPLFNGLTNTNLSFSIWSLQFIYISIPLVLVTTFITGLFPGIILSRINVSEIFKGNKPEKNRIGIHQILTTSQFAIAIVLMLAVISINKQVGFLHSKTLGFDKENVLYVETSGELKDREKHRKVKDELLKSPFITNIAYRGALPTKWSNGLLVSANKDDIENNIEWIFIDNDYFDLSNIEFVAGENPFKQSGKKSNYCVVNEMTVEKLGIEPPYLGKILYTRNNNREYTIKGVTKNVNTKSLTQSVDPCIYTKTQWNSDNGVMLFKLTGDRSKGIQAIESYFTKTFPGEPFEYHFLDDTYHKLYESEERAKTIISLFTAIALILTVLGLFAMVHFVTENRTKEIGVRKVNGAKVSEILAMLNKDFIKWVAIAFVIACPIAYYAMNKWLENFAYKTNLSWWIFALAGVLALGIALLTVSWQSWKAATRNPIEALRYE